MPFQAANEHSGRVHFGKSAGIEEDLFGICGDIPGPGKLGHRHAAQGKLAERAFGAGHEKAASIADAHDPGGAMLLLKLRGAEENFKFDRAFAYGVAR